MRDWLGDRKHPPVSGGRPYCKWYSEADAGPGAGAGAKLEPASDCFPKCRSHVYLNSAKYETVPGRNRSKHSQRDERLF